MNLFEINDEIERCFDEETGEIFDFERLNDLQMQKDEKIENIALFIKNLKAEEKALKEEKMNFQKRQQAVANKIASLQDYLRNALNGEKFKTTKVSISTRKTKSVEVLNYADFLADENSEAYLKYADPEINKKDLLTALKLGETFNGIALKESESLIIK